MKRGLVGQHLTHSFSKLIHERLDSFAYDLFETNDVVSFVQAKDYEFLNVTIPYKQTVMACLDELSEVAKAIGAVNLIVNHNGHLLGHNTDYDGFLYLLNHFKIDYQGKHIAIFGTGGASKMVQYALQKEHLTLFSRGEGGTTYNDLEALEPIQVIINTTPHHMYPQIEGQTLVTPEKVPHLETVVDLIYNPLNTPLMQMAKHSVNGLLMLVYQAVKAHEIVAHKKVDDAKVMAMYQGILMNKLNLVLIGMPMSGKSYLSRQLAKLYQKNLVDTDKLIEQQCQMTISEIFATHGEEYFRQLEQTTIKEVAQGNNQIISPGGGVVLSPENMKYLRLNSFIIFIDMDLTFLTQQDTSKRPLLSTPQSIIDLYHKRINLYKFYANATIKRYNYTDNALSELEGVIYQYLNS